MARLSEGELLVRIGKIWHQVKNAQARLTACDRTYGDGAELSHEGVELGEVVCPACWDVERELQ